MRKTFFIILLGFIITSCTPNDGRNVTKYPDRIQIASLINLVNKGAISIQSIQGTGSSTGGVINAVLRNQTRSTVYLDIYLAEPIVFQNHGIGQNMVGSMVYGRNGEYLVIEEKDVLEIKSNASIPVTFTAFCLDFEKENPIPSEEFSVHANLPIRLQNVLRKVDQFSRDHPEIDITIAAQVAIWLTQGVHKNEIRSRFSFTMEDERLAYLFIQ